MQLSYSQVNASENKGRSHLRNDLILYCDMYLILITAFTVLKWTQADIALLSMWGGIISAVVCIPFAGIMDKYGKGCVI